MFNVLIAEDSRPILRNIKGLVETSGLPVRVAATAANGEEALAACVALPIDILLTDIRMPKMTGLALIEEAKRIRPGLKTVLISGYNDFEYTRKAINLQVSDYLLKPVERSQLQEVMENVLAKLREEIDDQTDAFRDILDENELAAIRRDPEWIGHRHLLVVARAQPFTRSARKTREALEAVRSAIPAASWALPAKEPGEWLLMVREEWLDSLPSSGQVLPEVQKRLAEQQCEASVAGWTRPAETARLPERFREAARLLERRQLVFTPVILDCEQHLDDPEPSLERASRIGGMLASMAEQSAKDRLLLTLSEQLARWRGTPLRLAELKRIVALLSQALAAQLNAEDKALQASLAEKRERLFDQPDYESFCGELLAFAEENLKRAKSLHKKSGEELFEQIADYLRTNLYDNVTMQSLSERFHVSPSYISRVIKRSSGKTFVRYYQEMKVSEARRLISSRSEMRIKEISDALCFSDPHYFSKVFKEYVGCSPVEYKQRTSHPDRIIPTNE